MIEVKYKNEHLVKIDSPLYQKLLDAHKRLLLKDPTIWGPEASSEASIRMDWIDLPKESQYLLPQLDALSAKHRNLTNVILCGMGGSSLGPEVIAQTYGKKLFILDSTDPQYIAHALPESLEKTLVVIESKSGSTIETLSQKAFFEKLFHDAGLNKTDHMIIVTDPDSPLDLSSRNSGFTVINANPQVGGRFSVLGAFGLIPSALIGIDVSILLDSAVEIKESLTSNPDPALLAAYAIITGTQQYISVTDESSGMPGLSDWIEQLVAESTGKDGVGRLPIVLGSSSEYVTADTFSISFAGTADLIISGDLGSQFFFWEWVTALIAAGLSIDAFNQPNVQESKLASGLLLSAWGKNVPPLGNHGIDKAIALFDDAASASELITDFIQGINEDGYLAIMAYVDRQTDHQLNDLRNIIATKFHKSVTFGWGPRFLHSTGQFHKGGQPNGSFLQITAHSDKDYVVPGEDFTFKSLCMAQAIGDYKTLSGRGLRTLRLHLMDREAGITQLLEIAKKL